MKYGVLILLYLICSLAVPAQPLLQTQPATPSQGNTYAIVIGIAAYQDPDIPPLSFSNRDAIVFADFLMSAPGGAVPRQNIKLLIDSGASIGEVDKAIRWVMNNCRENDKVYFYFSGHGEMENVTMSKNGYLICYNTPSVAFVNMGLSIDYLNDVVNTISVQTKARVIVITDACHSGTMAGNKFKGNFFVGEQLMLKKQNEIRMASSKPDQLSNEKADWGGGRGVFSYYLVNGLQGGLADADHDKTISVGELKHYMEASMAKDPVLKTDGDVQTPVINGNADFKLASVIESEAVKIRQQLANDSAQRVLVMMSAPPLPDADLDKEPADYFFTILKQEPLEALTDSAKLNELLPNDIAFAIISKLSKERQPGPAKNKLAELENILKNDKEALGRFNLDLASAFLDVGQNVIANYLRGDEAELERRRYYNSKQNGYDVYTRMFSIAAKLSAPDKYYSTKATVLYHYFSGLALRLKIPLTANQAPLIEEALAHQKKALNLEAYAAYIYNELGVLYQYKKNYAEAEKNYNKAAQLSPNWAIPQSNLSGIYILNAAYDKAMVYTARADSLQKDLQTVSINRGFINEKQGNLLYAEEDYHQAIGINTRHFAPFERLGYVNLQMANYALADSFLYEADLRKKGYHFSGNGWDHIAFVEALNPYALVICNVDTAILDKKDAFAFFTWGVQEYRKKNYANAVRVLRKVVAIEAANPLVYHYLGKIYYDQQKWEEAELMFTLSLSNSKDFEHLQRYVDSVKSAKQYPYDHDCFERFFKYSYYRQVEDHYFLGTLYERWQHIEESEKQFELITSLARVPGVNADGTALGDTIGIEIDEPEKTAAYVKLWQLLEKQGRYDETEAVIRRYRAITAKQADEELNEFYRRMIDRFPANGDWAYRLGNLLYKYAPNATRLRYLDTIVRFPLLNREMFIDTSLYRQLDGNDSLALTDKGETGMAGRIALNVDKMIVSRTKYHVPGTGDLIPAADAIYLPRKDAITYLSRAAELIAEKETLADIHFKLGNTYLWAGSKKQAYPYFERSLALVPANANARLTLVDIYGALHKNRAAFSQLNYLNDSDQLNMPKRLLFARFNMYAGRFDKANESLNKTETYTTYPLPQVNDMRGLVNMLANKPKQAIAFYTAGYKDVDTAGRKFIAYSLARLYARTGNSSEAWHYLQLAVNNGFNYAFVLQQDNYLESLRSSNKWEAFVQGIKMKQYKAVVNGAGR